MPGLRYWFQDWEALPLEDTVSFNDPEAATPILQLWDPDASGTTGKEDIFILTEVITLISIKS